MESVRTDGGWTASTQLPGSASAYVLGQVSVGPDGNATAVWSGAASGTANWQLRAARTAWPTTLQLASADVPEKADLKATAGWAPAFTLNRPAVSWTLTFTDALSGTTQRVLTGTPDADNTIGALWNGRTASGSYVPNGRYTWQLDAVAEAGGASVQVGSGHLTVSGGAAVARDHGGTLGYPDAVGDLLTLNSQGGLTFQLGKAATGTFSGKITGTGWPTTVKAVPVGDVNGDRCNDVLVRMGNGGLRLYKPGCDKPLTPNTAYTTVGGTGWNQYDVLTAPGDISGDKRPDFLARNASTGAVYLYKGTSTGTFGARVKLYDDWRTYKKIVGVGDLDGDGVGDLLAQDKADNLYRYGGTGKGTFKARVKVFANWGGSYDVVVGVGDITDDGRADIVSRDTSGNLYRNSGDGKGSFGTRVKIGTGFGGYRSLS
ncbi:MAG: VCBS repeat-containing protein [Streptomyces sp.]|nr:VCBS repeat-containing protein [Streptomyces sp.]